MADLVRWVRLKLRKESGEELEKDSKKALTGVETGMAGVKKAALALGAAIASAFAVAKIISFGKAAVAAALESQKQYADLASTVNAAGESYQALEKDVIAAANAFEASTIHDDGEYAMGLQRLIALTGDVGASMNNMGLLADVAARFFDGEMAPAADLVAKAMNGNVSALTRIGLQAGSAQEALDLLANRSMGAAADRAATLDGRLKQLNNGWGNFVKEVGLAMLAGDGAGEVVNVLGAAVQALRNWVEENREAIARWTTSGIRFAIDAADVLLRTLLGLSQVLRGAVKGALAAGALGISWLARGYALAYEAAGKFLSLIGKAEWGNSLKQSAEWMREQADALRDYAVAAAEAGGEDVAAGLGRFARRMFSSDSLGGGGRPGPRVGGDTAMVGANARPEGGAGAEEVKELERLETRTDRMVAALERFGAAMATQRTLSTLLGDDFDALAAEASTLESTIATLAEEGMEPTDEALLMLRDRLREVRSEMALTEEATRLEEEAMRAQAFAAGELASALGMAMAGGLGPFAKGKARQNALEAAELTLRAVAAALTGFGAGKAGAFLGLAAKHGALAGAWGLLGSTVGGGGAPGGLPSLGGGGGGGISPTTARTTSSGSAARATPLGADIQIHFVGPGFKATNPEVQRVVFGATQEATERYGNVRVRTFQRNS